MFGLVDSLAGFVKIRSLVEKAIIDSCIARLHYRFTAGILFLACVLCTANSFIGNPIECMPSNNKDDNMQKVLNTYCWISSTFTLPKTHRKGIPGIHVAAQGVGHYVTGKDEEHYHAYYQWVPFVLFFQGLLFYGPHWFWKNWEDGKIRMLSDGIRGSLAETRDGRKEKQSRLVQYIVDSMDLHNWYALGYFMSEVLNFANVITNIYLTDKFLGGKFLTYGTQTLQFREMEMNPFHEIFPRVTKCSFRHYGPSGTIQLTDAMCVLAVNIINEKIYIFLWWWFIILAVLSGLALIYSISIIISPAVRRNILFRRFKYRVSEGARTIVSHTKVGDFFLLHLLGQNINMVVYTEILEELSSKLSGYLPSAPDTNAATLEKVPIYPKMENFLPQ